MNRDAARQILKEIELRYSANGALGKEIGQLKAIVEAERFQPSSAQLLLEKIARKGSKKLRSFIHNALVPRKEQVKAWKESKAKKKKKVGRPVSTNIHSPWQGGSPGQGKKA